MIQCHTFNSLTRLDLRAGGPYMLTQFVGGMAAPLFLLMAGMTSGFQMESLERRVPSARRRWLISLKRGGYILALAFAFRISNWLATLPHGPLAEITKVDILNCMGVGMAALAVAAVVPSAARARFAAGVGLAIAAVSPLVGRLPWDGAPQLLREYLLPGGPRGHFPFFPCVAYLAFGLAIGAVVKRAAAERMERLMQWSMLGGLGAIFAGQYFSNLPFSVYGTVNFWTESPGLIVIRTGICLMIMSGAYLWTEYGAGKRWSWMQAIGKNSLMVYWVHVMIVYGIPVRPIKRLLNVWQATLTTVIVTLLMVGMSAVWLEWKRRKAGPAIAPAEAAA